MARTTSPPPTMWPEHPRRREEAPGALAVRQDAVETRLHRIRRAIVAWSQEEAAPARDRPA